MAASAQKNTVVYDGIGGWTIRTDLDSDYHCFMEADYDNGSSVRAGFNSEAGEFYISIADYNWDWVEVGANYTVSLQFDDQPADSFSATGVVLETEYVQSGVRLHLPKETQDRLVSQFMNRGEMRLVYQDDDSLTLGLHGTRRATLALEDCQTVMASTASSDELSAAR